MKSNLDQKLIEAKPENITGNDNFAALTMRAVKQISAVETFDKVLRTTSVTKKGTLRMKLHNLHLRFNSLPRFAAVGLIISSTGTVGAAAYATYRWITPKVTITNIQQVNDDNKKQYTIDSQCGDFASGKALQYELSRSSGLTDEDAYKVFKNTCAHDALRTFISSRWVSDNDHDNFAKKKVGDIVTIYYSDNIFAGSRVSNPIFGHTIGKVTAIDQKQISFSLPLYSIDNSAHSDPSMSPFEYYPNGKEVSRTLTLAPNVEVWAQGKLVKLSDVRVGDQIQVVTRTQNKVQYYEDIHQNALGEQITFDTVGIIKTDVDARYVVGIGDPKIVNAITSLAPCDSNPEYSCVSPPNQALGIVYGVGDMNISSESNNKYLRKDIMDDKKMKHYQLHGRVTNMSGTHVTLETRGKKTTFTVDFPYDAVAEYNTPKLIVTNMDKSHALKLGVGDLIEVRYGQTLAENHKVIKSSDLEIFAIIGQTQPDGTLAKY